VGGRGPVPHDAGTVGDGVGGENLSNFMGSNFPLALISEVRVISKKFSTFDDPRYSHISASFWGDMRTDPQQG